MSKYFAVIRKLLSIEEMRYNHEGKREGIWGTGKVTETRLRMKCFKKSEKKPSLVWVVHARKKVRDRTK